MIWLNLEYLCADWAEEYGAVWVICGPVVFGGKPSSWIGDEGEFPVAVPDALFKIVVRETSSGFQVLPFIYPQKGEHYKRSSGEDWEYDHTPYLTSVDVIEAVTGLDFFTSLEDENEAKLESRIPIELWDVSE